MYRASAAAAAALLVATGCSGQSVSSAQDVADLVGCTDLQPSSEEVFITEGGPCDGLGDETWQVYYFASDDARENYLDTAREFGGGQYLTDDHWAVQARSKTLRDLQAEIGGDIVPSG